MALLAWLILIVGAARIYYLVIILNGTAPDKFCEDQTLFDVDKCKADGKTSMLIDCTIGWLFEIYFALVIMSWW